MKNRLWYKEIEKILYPIEPLGMFVFIISIVIILIINLIFKL